MKRIVVALAAAIAVSACSNLRMEIAPGLQKYKHRGSVHADQAGNLDDALALLFEQRSMFWEQANASETMINSTALGLTALGAVGIYKSTLGTDASARWLKKAALTAAGVYGGAVWLEPTARQKIFLAGATSLSCLALTAGPYEMSRKDFDRHVLDLATAREALEKVFNALKNVGRFDRGSSEAWRFFAMQGKARFADRVLRQTEQVLGEVEAVGPRLRDQTALMVSEVAIQLREVSNDLSKLPSALALLKPNANALIGSAVFDLPTPKAPTPDPREEEQSASDEEPAEVECKPEAASPETNASARKSTNGTGESNEDDSESVAREAAEAAKKSAASAAKSAAASAKSAKKADEARIAAERAAAAASSPTPAPHPLDAAQKAADELAAPLGKALSLLNRLKTARTNQQLPEACGSDGVQLVPDRRSIALRAGESFQFMLSGEVARPSVQVLTQALDPQRLDISMPAQSGDAVIRLQAGIKQEGDAHTTVRISDSKRQRHFDVSVRLCGKTPKQ